MEVAPRYKLITLYTLLTLFYIVYISSTAYTVYTVFTIQTALHCLNSCMYAHIYCQERLECYWNGLMQIVQNVGWMSG